MLQLFAAAEGETMRAFLIIALAILALGCVAGPGSGNVANDSSVTSNHSSPGTNSSTNVSGNATGNQTAANLTAINVTALSSSGLRMGSEDAPIIMVEFSDYQCQFCRRFWLVNFETLKKEYIDTGKVQFVYRDFPLSFHNAAEDSAMAVACAEEQGKGWAMHDKIFTVQANVSTSMVFYAKSDLKQWAGEIGLERQAFDECLDSGRYLQMVNQSGNDAVSSGFDGTPSFVIGMRNRTNYVTLQGALPYGTFRATIEQLLQNS